MHHSTHNASPRHATPRIASQIAQNPIPPSQVSRHKNYASSSIISYLASSYKLYANLITCFLLCALLCACTPLNKPITQPISSPSHTPNPPTLKSLNPKASTQATKSHKTNPQTPKAPNTPNKHAKAHISNKASATPLPPKMKASTLASSNTSTTSNHKAANTLATKNTLNSPSIIYSNNHSKHPPTKATKQQASSPKARINLAPTPTSIAKNTPKQTSSHIPSPFPLAPPQATLDALNPPSLPLHISTSYLRTLAHGTHIIRDGNQQLMIKTSLHNHLTILELYDEAHILRARLSLLNDNLEGISTAYDNNHIVREIPYKHGQIDGVATIYLSLDARLESPYKNGKKHGRATLYYHNTPISFKEYDNGLLHGIIKTASINTQSDINATDISPSSYSITHYQHGKKHGESIGYANHHIIFQQHYNHGVLEGQTRTYGENGIIKIVRNYHKGLLHGEEQVYNYPQGTLAYTSHYELGVRISPYTHYEQDGRMYYSMCPCEQESNNKQGLNNDTYRVTQDITMPTQEIWRYDNAQIALDITHNNGQKSVRSFYKDGTPASQYLITPTRASGERYTRDGVKESSIIYDTKQLEQITYTYSPEAILLTKSQETPTTTITQRYKHGVLDTKTITHEGEELTIQQGFFPNGSLHFTHHYVEGVLTQGALYAPNGALVYEFPYASSDMIFDIAFPNTTALKRARIMPSP